MKWFGRKDKPDKEAASPQASASSSSTGERANPFLTPIESSMFRHLPNLKIKPLVSHVPTAILKGPRDDVLSASHGDLASACSVSTYPHIPGEARRSGDPICDQFRINLYENRAIICIADGCNWGPKVLEAATRASDEFVEYLHNALPTLTETKQAKAVLINAIQAAHNKIFEGKVDQDGMWWEVGQTTLVGGVIVPIDKGNDRWSPSFEFLCASVGDCFREDDHQILTNRGFMFLDEVMAAVEYEGGYRVTDWRGLTVANFDEETQQIVYQTPSALMVKHPRSTDVVYELREVDGDDVERLSLAVTAGHELYVSLDGAPFGKVRADKLYKLAKRHTSIKLMRSARSGVRVGSDSVPLFAELGLYASPRSIGVFLELYGYWMSNGSAQSDRVCFHVPTERDYQFVFDRLADLRWLDASRMSSASIDVMVPALVRAFASLYDGCSAKLLFDWVLSSLSAADAQCVLAGMSAAANDATVIVADSVALRDQVVLLATHASYAASVAVTKRSQYAVHYGEESVVCDVKISKVPLTSRAWCFDMDDGFVVARNAKRVRADEFACAQQATLELAALDRVVSIVSRGAAVGDVIVDCDFALTVYDHVMTSGSRDGRLLASSLRTSVHDDDGASALRLLVQNARRAIDALNVTPRKFPQGTKWIATDVGAVSVQGNCKAFVYTNGQMQDVTDGAMRNSVADARDSGGRLGPAAEQAESEILQLADLGNYSLFCVPCEEGDLVLLMTDGVHDNLDPQHLGKKPRDMPKSMNLEAVDDWADVSADKAEAAKNIFRIAFLEKQVEGAGTPDELCSTLLDHCVKTTSASRKYMCENQGRVVPKDFMLYPGKMDHSSAAGILVSSRYPALVDKPLPVPPESDDNDVLNIGEE